jgi:hypothetical protein
MKGFGIRVQRKIKSGYSSMNRKPPLTFLVRPLEHLNEALPPVHVSACRASGFDQVWI